MPNNPDANIAAVIWKDSCKVYICKFILNNNMPLKFYKNVDFCPFDNVKSKAFNVK